MVAKLATSLGMTRGELESELKSSVQGIKITHNTSHPLLLERTSLMP